MEIIKGDLLKLAQAGKFDVIIQGCNCWNLMGGGIARQIRELHPDAAQVDARTRAGDYNKLGNFTMVCATEFRPFSIINAYTQFNTSGGEDVFEYEAFLLICKKVAHHFGTVDVGIPEIGCGLAGGNKEKIYSIFEYFGKILEEKGGNLTVVQYQV